MTTFPRRAALHRALVPVGLALASSLCAAQGTVPGVRPTPLQHVLLISVDGLHASDLQRWVAAHPGSAMAGLAAHGITYTQARTPAPADSFPGLLALVTGGTPAVTGVYYDVSYDRTLSPPGSDCKARGTVVRYDESLDLPGAPYGAPVLDAHELPLDPAQGCSPVRAAPVSARQHGVRRGPCRRRRHRLGRQASGLRDRERPARRRRR